MAESNDITNEYLASREDRMLASGSTDMLEWVMRNRGGVVSKPVRAGRDAAIEERPLDPFPTDREAPAEPSTGGSVMRNVGEVPRAAVQGVDAAIRNATGWALDPLVNWLNENVADLNVPVRDLTTPAGKATKSLSEFLTGFVPALRGLRGIGMAGKVVAPLTAAAMADFATKDPHEARLSNLWNQAGLPSNILTDYLAADPSDGAIEGRFKSAAESAFTGAGLEGLVLGARALRAAHAVKAVDGAEMAALKERYGEISDETFTKVIGDPSKPMIETVVKQPSAASTKVRRGAAETDGMTPADLIGGRGVVDAGEMKLAINFGRMEGPDDVKAAIADMSEKFKGTIDEARRGTITQRETESLADDLGMSVTDLLDRTRGQAFNAEQIVAARKLWQASGEKLLEAARTAADPNAGPLDQFSFRKMLATHHAIQAEVLGMRAEAGRALSAWKIPAGGGVEKARAIDQAIQAMGGPDQAQELARRLSILAEYGDKGALAKFAEKASQSSTMDAVREVWINGLLSSPTTHIINSSSNLATAFQAVLERGVAARIGELRGATDSVAPGEAMAMAYGLVSGVKDAFRLAAKSVHTGETGYALNKVDLPARKALAADTWNISSETGLGRFVDYLGEAARVPSRFLGAEDEFFKSIGYRMELHAQSLRQATSEGFKGDALGKRMREIILDPPENLRIASADAALYQTFTNAPGAIGQAFMGLRERVPAVSFVMPFVRTPVNIARYAFERSPFAPLVSQWRDDIAAGGARSDLALARMSTGTAVMAMALDMADSGLISGQGPKEAGEREAMVRQGWQANSFKVGDRWYSYNRMDGLYGSAIGFAADVAEKIRRGEINEDDTDEWQEAMAMGIAAVSQVAINKTYLQGLSDFVELTSDPTRYSEGYINKFVASFVPSSSGAVKRAVDPTVREATTPWEAVQAKVAGLSDKLPPRRNLWGEEIASDSGLGKTYDFFSPVQTKGVKPEPIDAEIMRLAPLAAHDQVDGSAPTRIGKRTTFQGVVVNFKDWPEVFDAYVKMAGNDSKLPGYNLGAKDFLNAVVTGQNAMSRVYDIQSDEMKVKFISEWVHRFRKLAQNEIMNAPQFNDFAEYVRSLQGQKQQSRMPVLQ